jgi:uncharacterized protein
MSSTTEWAWPEVDPDTPPAKPRRRRAVIALALVVTAAVVAAIAVARPAPTIAGVALPAPISAAPTSTTATTTAPTSTAPPVRRVTKLADHPLLVPGATLPDATCTLPAFRRDAGSLQPYYEELVRCLGLAWTPVLDANRLPHREAWVNVQEHPGETGCGDPDKAGEVEEFTAMYCSILHTLYLPVDRMLAVDEGRPAGHIAVLAHEFAHHVQEETGLLSTAEQEITRVGVDSAPGLEMSRRIELQANCFAGLMIAAAAGHGSISSSLANQAIVFLQTGPSSPTHGRNASQKAWATKGFKQRTTAACNTFAAPAREVS